MDPSPISQITFDPEINIVTQFWPRAEVEINDVPAGLLLQIVEKLSRNK